MIDALKKEAVFVTCTKPQCLNFFLWLFEGVQSTNIVNILNRHSGSIFCFTSHVTLTSMVSDQSLE